MKVIIVDDHELIREGLKKVLIKNSDIEIVGEAGDSQELLDLLNHNHNKVDIVILDISMPGRSGLELLRDIKDLHPDVKTLVLSMHPEDRFAIRTLKAGASGYLSKHSAAKELVNALRKIKSGGKYISQALAEQLALEIETPSDKPLHEKLSNREFEIMLKISLGKSVSEIAEELVLSVNTITSYRTRVMQKMNMRSNAEIIRYAIKNQLVD